MLGGVLGREGGQVVEIDACLERSFGVLDTANWDCHVGCIGWSCTHFFTPELCNYGWTMLSHIRLRIFFSKYLRFCYLDCRICDLYQRQKVSVNSFRIASSITHRA